VLSTTKGRSVVDESTDPSNDHLKVGTPTNLFDLVGSDLFFRQVHSSAKFYPFDIANCTKRLDFLYYFSKCMTIRRSEHPTYGLSGPTLTVCACV
jgi:hypothetical protein